jgi:hypothetical protein
MSNPTDLQNADEPKPDAPGVETRVARPTAWWLFGAIGIFLLCGPLGLLLSSGLLGLGEGANVGPNSNDSAPPSPAVVHRTVTCKGLDITEKLTCAKAEDCPDDGASIICRWKLQGLYDGSKEQGRINNWKQDGVWDRKFGHWTLTDLFATGPGSMSGQVSGKEMSFSGIEVRSSGADVLIVGDPITEQVHHGRLLVLAQFGLYNQNFMTDDLLLIAEEAYTGEAAEAQRSAWRLHRLLSGLVEEQDVRAGGSTAELVGDLWAATSKLERNDRVALLAGLKTTAAQVESAALDAKRARVDSTRPTFEQDDWARTAAIAVPWDDSFEEELLWLGQHLPDSNRCRQSAPANDDNAAQVAAKREEALSVLAKYARVIPLEVRAVKSGTSSKARVNMVAKGDKVAISGNPRIKSVRECFPACCNIFTNECTSRWGSCEIGEVPRTRCETSKIWGDTGISVDLIMPAPVTVEKDEPVAGVSAEAVVVVNRAVRSCSDQKLAQVTGDLVGYRVVHDGSGETIKRLIEREVSLEEALAGPAVFKFAAAAASTPSRGSGGRKASKSKGQGDGQ